MIFAFRIDCDEVACKMGWCNDAVAMVDVGFDRDGATLASIDPADLIPQIMHIDRLVMVEQKHRL